MTEYLYRLVYYSRNKIAVGATDLTAEIHMILAASRYNNGQADVTGALMFNSGFFGQVLEGPRRAVEATFERIQRDPRHSDVSLLAFEPTEARAFANWSMGFVGAKSDDVAQYQDIAGESGFDPARMKADDLFNRLHSIALEEERQASWLDPITCPHLKRGAVS